MLPKPLLKIIIFKMKKQNTLYNQKVKFDRIGKNITLFLFFVYFSTQMICSQTPYVMSGGDYSETFTNISNATNWPNGFNGTDSQEWSAVGTNASGVLGDGVKVTVATSTFSTGSSGGIQRGSTNLYMLSTSTTNSCAIDLLLDFTGRTAGTISFDVAEVTNSTGDRDSKIKLFYSIDGTTFTELTGTNLPYTARNNVSSSASITSIVLPSSFDNSSSARLRFYEYSTSTGGTPTGSQPKISIDNIAITSTASCTPPGTQASILSFSSVTNTGTTVSWVRGNGTAGVVVVAKASSIVDSDPISGTTYTANSSFSSGTQIGTGNYVVYKGTGTSVSVTGLSAGTTYYYSVYEYNTTGTCFKTAGLSGSQLTTGSGTSSPTDYFRSLSSGNWNTAGTWQSSPDNNTWITSTLVPTSSAASITIQTSHTVTINANATASNITISGTGTLTFDGGAARDLTVTGNITISSSGGSFITQTSGTFTNTMSVAGDITNAGTFDMSRGGTNFVCTVTFNKNGNQTISGSGAITRFSYIVVNMGTSNSNILEISSSDFQACANFLHSNSAAINQLQNGTIKFSGSYTLNNTLFQAGSFYQIVATAGVWLNNVNVTTAALTDSYDLYGLLRVTSGTFNVGTSSGNSIRYFAGSIITIEGGSVNIAGRLYCNSIGQTTTCTITGGTITLCTQGSNTSSTKFASFQMTAASTFVWSGGTIVLQQGQAYYGGMDYSDASTHATVTGGTLQIANASSGGGINEFYIYSINSVPNLSITTTNSPIVYLFSNTTVFGNITIASNATLDTQADPNAYAYELANPGTTVYSATAAYDLSLTGNWSNSGTFTNRSKTVTFNGSSAQTIIGSVATNFYNLTIFNTSGGVSLGINATTTHTLTLTSGKFSVQGYILTIGTSSANGTISGGSVLSYIIAYDNNGTIGYLKQFINSAGGTSYSYPIGDVSNYTPLNYTLTTGTLATADLTVYTKANSISGMNLAITQYINRYWSVTPTGITSSTYSISYTYVDGDIIGGTETGLLPIKKSGTTWYKPTGSSFTTGIAQGSGSVNAGTNTLTWTSLSTYSDFSAAIEGGIALPLELISFTGKKVGKNNELFWGTASEFNNDFFTIEKSTDGENFRDIENIDGVGNSTMLLKYSIVDYDVKELINYYRLRQTDFDGENTYSEIITIDNRNTSYDKQISIITNLFGQQVNQYYQGIVIIQYQDGSSLKTIQ